MMETQGQVIGIRHGRVLVRTVGAAGCGSCAAGRGCGAGVLGKLFRRRSPEVEAVTDIDVDLGDQVIIGMDDTGMLYGSLALYGAPLAGLLVGMTATAILFPGSGDAVVLMAGLAGMLAGLVWLTAISRRIADERRYRPVVLRRVGNMVSSPLS